MVGGEAQIDWRERIRLGIVQFRMTGGLVDRKELCRGLRRTLAAEGRRVGIPDARGEPEPSLRIEHLIMHTGVTIPDRRVTPVGRRRGDRVVGRSGRVGIAPLCL